MLLSDDDLGRFVELPQINREKYFWTTLFLTYCKTTFSACIGIILEFFIVSEYQDPIQLQAFSCVL